MNILTEPVMIKFERADGSIVVEADLVDLMSGVYECSNGKSSRHECIRPFQAWIKKQCGSDVTASQAETIYVRVSQEYEAFKKKLANGSLSPTHSDLTPDVSIAE